MLVHNNEKLALTKQGVLLLFCVASCYACVAAWLAGAPDFIMLLKLRVLQPMREALELVFCSKWVVMLLVLPWSVIFRSGPLCAVSWQQHYINVSASLL